MSSGHTKISILSAPGARALLGSSIIARLPLAMLSIALLVHAQRLTGSFAVAGAVSGAYAIASAISAPLLGGIVDRCGQTRVLISGATVTAAAVVTEGLLPSSAPPLLVIALGAATGLFTPPLAACVRTLLPVIVAEPSGLPALFAFESTALELTFVLGPPLALGVGALWSTGAALALGGLVMLAGTLAFAAQPASRRWRPEAAARRPRGGSLNSATMRTLVVILFGTGVVFGATEVGVTAAAHALGSSAAAGPVLGLWGVGSLLGGIAATRLGGAQGVKGLTLLLAALALAHAALILTTASMVAVGAVIVLAGAMIAPTVSSIYAMVDVAAPAGTRTEAFSWALTASLTGSALGAAGAGALAQSAGASAAFALVGAAGAVAVLAAILRSRSLEPIRTRDSSLEPRARRGTQVKRPPPPAPRSRARGRALRDPTGNAGSRQRAAPSCPAGADTDLTQTPTPIYAVAIAPGTRCVMAPNSEQPTPRKDLP
ncbi:MAG: MFS transporter [Solirubrobacteraceae bacterium]